MSIGRIIKARVVNPKGKRLYRRSERVTATFRPEDVVLVPANPDAENSNTST
jgi:hypothetical protein